MALIGLSCLMAIGLSLFSRFIILILYGDKFVSGINLLALLGWSLIPYTISSFISYDLIARGEEIALVKATAISLVLFMILNIWLISVYELNGAVYASLVGETLQAFIFIQISKNSAIYKVSEGAT